MGHPPYTLAVRVLGLMFIRTGWYLTLGAVFGVLSFMRTNAFKQRTGTSPWHIHPLVWGLASVFVAVFGTLLSIIACSTSPQAARRRHAGAGSPVAGLRAKPLTAWLPDPTGRHELRYYDGAGWTGHVANGGVISVDDV